MIDDGFNLELVSADVKLLQIFRGGEESGQVEVEAADECLLIGGRRGLDIF